MPNTPPMSEQDLVSLNKDNLDRAIGFVQFADSKASLLLTISLALVPASVPLVPTGVRVVLACLNPGGAGVCMAGLLVLLYGAFLFCAITSVVKLVDVVKPRLVPQTRRKSPLYYDTINQTAVEEFKKTVTEMPYAQAIDELADQTYNNSVVAARKYALVKEGLDWMMWSGVFGMPFVVLVQVFGVVVAKS